MTETSKTEELSDRDLDSVEGGFQKIEVTSQFTATDDLAKSKAGWKVEEGEKRGIKKPI